MGELFYSEHNINLAWDYTFAWNCPISLTQYYSHTPTELRNKFVSRNRNTAAGLRAVLCSNLALEQMFQFLDWKDLILAPY